MLTHGSLFETHMNLETKVAFRKVLELYLKVNKDLI